MNILVYQARESTPERPLYKARGTLGELRVWVGPLDDRIAAAADAIDELLTGERHGLTGDFVIDCDGSWWPRNDGAA